MYKLSDIIHIIGSNQVKLFHKNKIYFIGNTCDMPLEHHQRFVYKITPKNNILEIDVSDEITKNRKDAYCENCSDNVDFGVKLEKETYNIKGTSVTCYVLNTFCKECGQPTCYIDTIERINEKLIYSAYDKINKK